MPQRNPRLFELAGQMSDAQEALATAQDKVDWIVAEWRHLWPLAPEQILHCANMHEYSSSHAVIERDLAGNPMMRDIEPLTMRLSPEFRQQGGKTCFSLCTVQFAEERLLHFAANPPTGRTPKALARNVALRAERVRDWTAKLETARKYEVETARIRELSGIEAAIPQVEAAGKRVQALLAEIMQEPAHTMEGLRIKLRLIQQYVLTGPNAEVYAKMRSIPMGWIGPFAEDVAGIIGEAV